MIKEMVTVTISIPFELFLETFPTYGLIVLVDKFDTLNCRKKKDKYAIIIARWQKFSDVSRDKEVLHFLANYANEFWFMVWMLKGKKVLTIFITPCKMHLLIVLMLLK